ncbi:GIY-YIG nuclease family protein [Bacillus sp. T33-2]|uniref:GIY-YIG nuclease family protein n=1 Tax=Bacillus sp. T33-2 TaxID=2054168 RepID=UPI000C78B829|nr:GIY-YIG nuclease family protein [Bacillus sp. T33-2]PLR98899.1 DUF123 domain-containing protein [Bacillus sp. T33-2]
MTAEISQNHTLYTIYLDLKHNSTVSVGRLGTFFFEKGTYIYVGSAKKNIKARVNRHRKLEKPKRWHIDYLRQYGEVTKIITYEHTDGESALAEKIRKKTGGINPVKGFGSSDCKCFSHLIFSPCQ